MTKQSKIYLYKRNHRNQRVIFSFIKINFKKKRFTIKIALSLWQRRFSNRNNTVSLIETLDVLSML